VDSPRFGPHPTLRFDERESPKANHENRHAVATRDTVMQAATVSAITAASKINEKYAAGGESDQYIQRFLILENYHENSSYSQASRTPPRVHSD
jgi:hypothetical protein